MVESGFNQQGIGNAPTGCCGRRSDRELNHYHDPRVAELADICDSGRATAAQ